MKSLEELATPKSVDFGILRINFKGKEFPTINWRDSVLAAPEWLWSIVDTIPGAVVVARISNFTLEIRIVDDMNKPEAIGRSAHVRCTVAGPLMVPAETTNTDVSTITEQGATELTAKPPFREDCRPLPPR